MKYCMVVSMLFAVLISEGYAQDTVRVKGGWNNIGSPRSGLPPVELQTIPAGIIVTAFYRYNPGAGYESSDTLEKDRGYWVKVSADGVIIFGGSGPADTCDVQALEYDGFTYHTVKIGDKCWLKENLVVGVMIQGTDTSKDNGTTEKYCYDNDSGNCATYGGLYRWDEAMQYAPVPGVQGICPPDWHIPTEEEFQALSSAVGGDGNALKAIGQGSGGGAGTNTSAFSALLAGFRDYTNTFLNLGATTAFWSSTFSSPYARVLDMNSSSSAIGLSNAPRPLGFSVRCVQD